MFYWKFLSECGINIQPLRGDAVLILVLLEVPIGDKIISMQALKKGVLILVLLEVPIGEGNA